MTATYEEKLDNFCRGKSYLRPRGNARALAGFLCEACGSGQPGWLYGIRELLTGLDHFVGSKCLEELTRRRAVLQGRVRETTEEAFGRAYRSKDAMANAGLKPDDNDDQRQPAGGSPIVLSDKAEPMPSGSVSERLNGPEPSTTPIIFTPSLAIWETQDCFRVAVQVQGRNGSVSVWGPAEQPKCRQDLTIHADNGFILTKEGRYDRTALARCVRVATQNAYLTLKSQTARPSGDGGGKATLEGPHDG